MNFFLIHISVFGGIVALASAFIPTRFLAWEVEGRNIFLDDVDTHEDITTNAILNVTAAVFKDNPNPQAGGSSSRVDSLSRLSVRNLTMAYYGTIDRGKIRTFENAIAHIADANGEVDLQQGSSTDAAAHFYSEQIEDGQRLLIQKYDIIVDEILSENFDRARTECGRLLHTLQDFYSHTNWIENGNSNTFDSLGRRGASLGSIAGPNVVTCTDCTLEPENMQASISTFPAGTFRRYSCRDNLIQDTPLTSGYFAGQLNQNGEIISKPPGKCGSGGFLDLDRDNTATGGINKDTPIDVFSPHFYLYEEAARLATQASIEILQRLREDVSNDSLFAMFLGVSLSEQQVFVERASIAYVIDTTGSMGEELPEIQASIPQIRSDLEAYARNFADNTQIRYILVPFNDPDPGITIETNDVNQFITEIGRLTANGGGDVPEPSIGATIQAIEASEPGSPIYVYTDAAAKDSGRRSEAQTLISMKNTPIFFVLVNLSIKRKRRSLQNYEQGHYSRIKRQSSTNIYEQLAVFSGGQILNVDTGDISELSSLVSSSAVRSRRTIFRSSASESATYIIPIDSSTLEASISISGTQITVSVLSPQGINAGSITEYSVSLNTRTTYIARLNVVDDSLRGNWTINIVSTTGAYSIQVLGASDLRIAQNIYQLDFTSVFGYRQIEGKPVQGEPLIVLLTAEIDNSAVTISRINIVSNNGANIQPVNDLISVAQCCFAGVFVPPAEAYTFQVIGMDGRGYSFSHFTDTAIQVSSVLLSLDEGERRSISIRLGEETNTSVVVQNYGDSATYLLSATLTVTGTNGTVKAEDFVSYSLSLNSIFLETNGSETVVLNVDLFGSVQEDALLTFLITAQLSTNADVNNFIEIEVLSTSRPIPVLNGTIIATPAPPTMMESEVTKSGADIAKAVMILEICSASVVIMWNSVWKMHFSI